MIPHRYEYQTGGTLSVLPSDDRFTSNTVLTHATYTHDRKMIYFPPLLPPYTRIKVGLFDAAEVEAQDGQIRSVRISTDTLEKAKSPFTLLHEIGHVWAYDALGERKKREFKAALQKAHQKESLAPLSSQEQHIVLEAEYEAWKWAYENITNHGLPSEVIDNFLTCADKSYHGYTKQCDLETIVDPSFRLRASLQDSFI